ncbi:transposase [Achromobacter sp. Marseille-Q4954]|uniref:transposase n=1 Tax=Achromobacter sp. Marseille-Q4954 TaxID=2942203 RepID=UPI0033654952
MAQGKMLAWIRSNIELGAPMAPRLPRVVIAHTPHHVVQRGHSRQAIFTAPEDYQTYLCDLKEKSTEPGVRVYAYCLMTNHVHLLLMPTDETMTLAKLMQEIGRRATRRWNQRWGRSGTDLLPVISTKSM